MKGTEVWQILVEGINIPKLVYSRTGFRFQTSWYVIHHYIYSKSGTACFPWAWYLTGRTQDAFVSGYDRKRAEKSFFP